MILLILSSIRELDVFIFFNFIQIDLLSLLRSGVQAQFFIFFIVLFSVLSFNDFFGVIEKTLHEFGMSLVLGSKLY